MERISYISSIQSNDHKPQQIQNDYIELFERICGRILSLKNKIDDYIECPSQSLLDRIREETHSPISEAEIIKINSKVKQEIQNQDIKINIKAFKSLNSRSPLQQLFYFKNEEEENLFSHLCQFAPLEILELLEPDDLDQVVNRSCKSGYTPLLRALQRSPKEEVIRYLVSRGADVNQSNSKNHCSPLLLALIYKAKDKEHGEKICKFLKSEGARLLYGTPANLEALHDELKLNEKEKEDLFHEIKKTAAAELNYLLRKEKNGFKTDILSALSALQKLLIKSRMDEVLHYKNKKEPIFIKACFLLKKAIVSPQYNSDVKRYQKIIQKFIECGADLRKTSASSRSGFSIFSCKKKEMEDLLIEKRDSLLSYAAQFKNQDSVNKFI